MNITVFEDIKQFDEEQNEYWKARDLAKALDYTDYRNFLKVIDKAKESAKNSGQVVHNHFVDVNEMVTLGSGAQREIDDLKLSRYACYLIIQNSDPTKEVVALGQTYFAIQTKRQEDSDTLVEDGKRVVLRDEITVHNTSLASSAKKAGVSNFGTFQNAGYKGLYGMTAQNIHKKKQLKKSQSILDHMGSEELAANLFRATQADAKLKREAIQGEAEANLAHYEVGQKVRQTIDQLGGTMPENLPVADGINKAKTRLKKLGTDQISEASDE